MRFVPVKTVDQQPVLMLHRTRQLFIRQRTTLINSIRAHLAEFGIVAGIGRNGVEVLLELIATMSLLDLIRSDEVISLDRLIVSLLDSQNHGSIRWHLSRLPTSAAVAVTPDM